MNMKLESESGKVSSKYVSDIIKISKLFLTRRFKVSKYVEK